MVKSALLLGVVCTSFFAGLALAQDAPAFLTKDQAMASFGGKAFTYARADGTVIRWQFTSDGNVYGNNRSSTKKDAGEWSVQDNGSVCIKWRGSSGDSCSWYFQRDGKLMRSGGRSEESVAKAVVMQPD